MELPFDPVILLLGICVHPCVHCSTTYNSQDLETAQVPLSRQVDREAVVHLQSGTLLSC